MTPPPAADGQSDLGYGPPSDPSDDRSDTGLDRRPALRLRDRGPAVVRDDVPIVRAGRDAVERTPWPTRPVDVPDDDRRNVALCRCGQSATRPFCDGSHRGTDRLGSDVRTTPPQAAMPSGTRPRDARASGLPPCLVLEDDGPLRCCGGITVTLPDGRAIAVADGTGLCRCGASDVRPWCDGRHAACGFTESG